ncbi:aspartyl-tRNA(Asn)/glutamyl-tRNA(Gln) amidotransferase subunit A [Rhodoligotrophos appendicifer]|uniref:amidase n=1 Tax=Rhodoligotrophos appendicifer TaxID=987056 RepID=UPI0011855468|nr:amidase [Rhodoligotrophos appendicifer]
MDLATAPLRAIAEALETGRLTTADLAEAAIAARASSRLEAYLSWAPDLAREMARAADDAFSRGDRHGLLQGIPVSIKDLFGVTGLPTYGGSPKRLPAKFEQDGPIIASLRSQIALFMGKTLTSELGFGVCGHNIHWGTPRSPWDPHVPRPAGGSSTGAAISVIEGSAMLGLGSDTGGSAREPANMTGIVGVKLTHGRWSGAGLVPPGPHLHGPGLLARTAQDAAFAFAALDPHLEASRFAARSADAELAAFRIGVLDDFFWNDCDPGIAEAAGTALDELREAGAQLEACSLPEVAALRDISPDWDWGISGVEFSEFLQSELPEWVETLHPGARAQLRLSEDMSAITYLKRCRQLAQLRRSADHTLAPFDVVVCPTSPMSSPAIDALLDPETYKRINRMAVRNMSPANLLDLCALTMPVGLDATGMPVGLHLMARNGEDETLLIVACALERVLGTGRQRLGVPPLCVKQRPSP